MKIVYVDETFHPAYGYQSNPLAKFQKRQGHDVTIITVSKDQLYPSFTNFGATAETIDEDDRIYTENTGVKIIRVKTKGYFMHRAVLSPEVFRKVRTEKPDVVFVHCVETLTSMRFLVHRKEWPLMFDSHMLTMASRYKHVGIYEKFYRAFFRRIIEKHHYYVIRTQDDDYVNSHLGIKKELTPFISFGTDTLLFRPSPENRRKFRAQYGIGEDSFVVIYTGKLTQAKGGLFLAETFREKFDIDLTLVCVGSPPDNEYGGKVRQALERSENRVVLFPTQRYVELAPFYQMADLSVFPKQCSMSFYDAQACGLPVVSEDNNVNRDRCSHGNGAVFNAGDAADFRAKILQFAAMRREEYEQYSRNARAFIEAGYDYADIAEQYTEYLKKSIVNDRSARK